MNISINGWNKIDRHVNYARKFLIIGKNACAQSPFKFSLKADLYFALSVGFQARSALALSRVNATAKSNF